MLDVDDFKTYHAVDDAQAHSDLNTLPIHCGLLDVFSDLLRRLGETYQINLISNITGGDIIILPSREDQA